MLGQPPGAGPFSSFSPLLARRQDPWAASTTTQMCQVCEAFPGSLSQRGLYLCGKEKEEGKERVLKTTLL